MIKEDKFLKLGLAEHYSLKEPSTQLRIHLPFSVNVIMNRCGGPGIHFIFISPVFSSAFMNVLVFK